MTPVQRQQERNGIKDVLVLQYGLHEVGHHGRAAGGSCPLTPVEPIAHTVSDIYKCLHQGTFGVGHNIRSPDDFRHRLAGDLDQARPTGADPLLENVSSDGSILRVNLRPFRAVFDGDEERGCDLLLQVCLASAAIPCGSPKRFFGALELFRELNRSGELIVDGRCFSFPEPTVDGFLQEIGKLTREMGFIPVLSHSPVYKSFNDPSYRVVHLKAFTDSPLAYLMKGPHHYTH